MVLTRVVLVAVRIALLLRTPAWSKRGSDMGPISVVSGSFPLSNALIDTAKLLRLRQTEDWGG
jgi:hypothetical protein